MKYEAVIARANGINPEGSLTEDARATVELALDHYRPDMRYLIMSDNLSYKAGFRPPISEAQAMKDYAVSLGVSSDEILTETESRDTFGNAFFTKVNLLGPLAIDSVLIVAGPNHSRERLEYIFRKVLGGAYSYDFVLHDVDRPAEQERERQSVAKLKNMFDDVPDGDVAALYARLRTQHPAYQG